jgi:hypothetical protein
MSQELEKSGDGESKWRDLLSAGWKLLDAGYGLTHRCFAVEASKDRQVRSPESGGLTKTGDGLGLHCAYAWTAREHQYRANDQCPPHPASKRDVRAEHRGHQSGESIDHSPPRAAQYDVSPAMFERAALRWHARYVSEAAPSLLQAQIALAALGEIRAGSDLARRLLGELAGGR